MRGAPSLTMFCGQRPPFLAASGSHNHGVPGGLWPVQEGSLYAMGLKVSAFEKALEVFSGPNSSCICEVVCDAACAAQHGAILRWIRGSGSALQRCLQW
mmetsp:Transcript_54558/g.122054  ORF Transcript_54558/g.122054 Transcript_54558/m.122054 type:complete len:99 (+) Transcript_54558:561-857(+)